MEDRPSCTQGSRAGLETPLVGPPASVAHKIEVNVASSVSETVVVPVGPGSVPDTTATMMSVRHTAAEPTALANKTGIVSLVMKFIVEI